MNDIKTIQKKIVPILKNHQVKRAAIFGSYVRGEQTKKSDLDLLIKYDGRSRRVCLI